MYPVMGNRDPLYRAEGAVVRGGDGGSGEMILGEERQKGILVGREFGVKR